MFQNSEIVIWKKDVSLYRRYIPVRLLEEKIYLITTSVFFVAEVQMVSIGSGSSLQLSRQQIDVFVWRINALHGLEP